MPKTPIHIILYEPEIPNNTGSIIRLCANTGAQLHLVKPLGFELDDKKLRRAGLDYHEWADMHVWDSLDDALSYLKEQGVVKVLPMTTKAKFSFFDKNLSGKTDKGDNFQVAFLFGPESRGLPEEVRLSFPEADWSRLPMQPDSRSLNLANSVSIAVYEAWRQQGFGGCQ